MTNYEIWKALNVAIDKDGYGGEFTPTDYEDIAKEVNLSFLKSNMEELYKNIAPGRTLNQVILSSKFFRNLLTRDTITPTTGVVNLSTQPSTTYGFWVSMTGVYSGQIRKIELVTHEEFERRNMSLTAQPFTLFPVAIVDGVNCRLYPTNITSVNFTYIKIPANPIFDYYSDSNDNIVYMAASASVDIPTGSTYYDGTAGPVTKASRTVEFVYEATFHSDIFSEMLRILANRLRDQETAVLAETQLNKQR